MKTVTVMLILVSLATVAIAADTPKISLNAQSVPVEQVVADVSKQAGVQILVDSDVKGDVTGQFNNIELENLLEVLAKSNGFVWQKLYLPAQSDQKLTPAQIKARADALKALAGGAVVVCDPTTGKQKVFVEQESASPSIDPVKLGMKPVYLIAKSKEASPAGADSDVSSRVKSLQDERMKLMAEMTPEERVGAMQQEMMSMMYLDPGTRQQMMVDQMNARRNMDPQMREAYQEMMRDTFRTMREQGLMPEFGRDRGGNRQSTQGGRNRTYDGGNRGERRQPQGTR